eukprot:CCRYP_012601-RA/>CCRYP_012601-RA protein AED:0.23 eAED:-0.06 QI:0/0/0/0.14/1/1/7/0/253
MSKPNLESDFSTNLVEADPKISALSTMDLNIRKLRRPNGDLVSDIVVMMTPNVSKPNLESDFFTNLVETDPKISALATTDLNMSFSRSSLQTDLSSKHAVVDSVKSPLKICRAERKKTNIEALIAFKEKNGHCRVPQRQQNLGRYVNNLREDYKRYCRDPSSCKCLMKDLVDQLNSLGFEWAIKKPREENWNDKYGMLLEFRQENNHCDVPRNTKLGRWVAEQRKYYKKKDVKNLGQEKIDKLEKVGFKWKAK